jgi:hypothetical protein
VHTIIPNAAVLSEHLKTLAQACSATVAILFKRTTFLVIATSAPPDDGPGEVANDLRSTRCVHTSEAMKHSYTRMRKEFDASHEIELPGFTVVLDCPGMDAEHIYIAYRA